MKKESQLSCAVWILGYTGWDRERGNSLCAIKKDCNGLCAPGKVQRSSAPLLQLFCALHATAVSLGANAIKLQV